MKFLLVLMNLSKENPSIVRLEKDRKTTDNKINNNYDITYK